MEIKVPAVGESVYEAVIARWLKKSGDVVSKDEPLCEIETDKVTLEVTSEADGVLTTLAAEGETVKIGAVIATIDARGAESAPAAGAAASAKSSPAAAPAAPAAEAAPAAPAKTAPKGAPPPISPSGRKLARELGVEPQDVQGSGRGGRVTREDLLKAEGAGPAPAGGQPSVQAQPAPAVKSEPAPAPPSRPVPSPSQEAERVVRKPMTQIRKRIAQRLVSVRQQTAMLTTFNEADMSQVMLLRQKYGEHFLKRHGVKLGLMSFFVRACCEALAQFPDVNARIDGDDIVYHNFCDIGIAVGSERGLVVPVLRGAESLTLAGIEQQIAEYAEKVRKNRIAIADLEGGTFTISNGGVYGSMLSTPILNPPQSGVLGMHAIQKRAVVVGDEIVIRPMMYLALSYDHRIVDGQGAVGFLKLVKEYIEEPEELLLEG
ncbi:dihydrolipoamide succinyltransferase [Geoanaerobacter pelophilus]|uniref:Dihydrolipoyllysine-residue succinyltransferase component of 2-oxoglutarate dehydrogenase complex n=1 Tax=Geoanaerobacter pelophilus TaxID=60036 RepID=A0ABQ0MKH6_9BACT|nr:2-oxoglutarate dehydrogenase complex dihydrolipoyllysine-residue succinyltransferase [Geoanaerobacter pelophilus]GAW67590.1 dihydrolipoamide succinyltransferase [Geoanaerobacter pelophilus]